MGRLLGVALLITGGALLLAALIAYLAPLLAAGAVLYIAYKLFVHKSSGNVEDHRKNLSTINRVDRH